MSENRDERGTEQPRAKRNFKLDIDERDLRTGNFTPLPEDRPRKNRGQQASYAESSYNRPYATEEERRAEKKAHKKRNKLKARKNKRVFSIVWICMVLLLSFTLASYLIGGSNDFFAVDRSEGETEVTIPENVTPEQLSQILYDKGAIKEKTFFELYSKLTVANWEWFEPGVYKLATNKDYEDIINTLQGGNDTREVVRITFPEGSNALEISQLLADNEVCTAEAFLSALNEVDFTNYDEIALMGETAGKYYKVEGYLFPDTYDFWKGEEVESVIGKMLNNFHTKINGTVMATVEQSGYSLDQIVIIASIIQNEAADSNDMKNVSAVIHNRLNFGAENDIFFLECDSTSYYPYRNAQAVPETGALPYGNYDTYQVQGLPAGAICNPGMDAINAALKPNTEGEAAYYLYFCHAADGTAYYATNSWDHEYNKKLAGLQ